MAAAKLSGCTTIEPVAKALDPPAAPREFRGAWIASVSNIDWPSRPALPVEVQQDEARRLVRIAREAGLNALILQVRPAADALYVSAIEPWSEYLTGEQGRGPDPPYDPLAFWIAEAHRAGLALHAWFNPFRARHSSARGPLTLRHFANTRPGSVRPYGDMLWMDPGDPAAAEVALAVILDVLRRYEVDGVHIDDYFYPYPVKGPNGEDEAFDDRATWGAYKGPLTLSQWRRENVDRFVERLYYEVRRENARALVGVSPFGIGRPDRRPAGIAGFSQYDAIYADVERWLENGWMDYLAPQLYWKSDSPGQRFSLLLEYWQSQNRMGRHVWPGLFTSRIDATEKSWTPEDIAGQIELSRARDAQGHIHFSMAALAQDRRGIVERLHSTYANAALVPATPWLANRAPPAPAVNASAEGDVIRIATAQPTPWLLATWALYGEAWHFSVLPRGEGAITRERSGNRLVQLVVSSVDRAGMESDRVRVRPR
ncbi:MAG TPA: family 10 glycosylhydrolase [Usitatibacter sp.]|nr:family 10 glycosylhydrolase [Usitatibacter sp.]